MDADKDGYQFEGRFYSLHPGTAEIGGLIHYQLAVQSPAVSLAPNVFGLRLSITSCNVRSDSSKRIPLLFYRVWCYYVGSLGPGEAY